MGRSYRPGRAVRFQRPVMNVGLLAGFGVTTWGCGAAGVSVEPAVSDSAGVTIVSNPAFRESTVPAWTVGAEPELQIGNVEGDPRHQLWRVHGVLDLSGGRIAVGNEGSGEVRIYSANGEYVASLGGRGEGPGEFQDLALVGALGEDTLVVVDESLGRITFLHPQYGLLCTVPIEGDVNMRLTPRGMSQDGTLLVGGGFVFPPDPPGTPVLVFDTLGVPVAHTELPEGLALRSVGMHYILARRWDDLGTEYVVRYWLDRDGG